MADREYKKFAGPSVNNAGYHNYNWDLFFDGNELRDVAFSSLSAAIKAIGTSSKTLYITTQHSITSSLSTPSNISLIVLCKDAWNISTGKTLTINGPYSGFHGQHFTGAGSVVFGRSIDIPAEWFGAAVGGTVESGLAAQAAVNSILAVGGNVDFQDGSYKVSTQIVINTAASLKPIGLRGKSMLGTIIEYYGSVSPAIKVGTTGATLDNSGFANLTEITVSGTNAVGEVDGIWGRKGQRYSYWNNVRAVNFAKGVGMILENQWLLGWGNLYSLSNFQAMNANTMNAMAIATINVENCGPWSTYTHSTILNTDPSVYIQGQGCLVDEVSIEAGLAINSLRIKDEVVIGSYYSESNLAASTGNEVSLRGSQPAINSAIIYHGTYGAPPNPRYILGMGDSVGARVKNFETKHSLPDPTNSTFGVDFETSTGAVLDVNFNDLENLSQAAAYQQYVKWNNNPCTLNGVRMIAGMPYEKAGRILLEGYSQLPVEYQLMQRPGASGNALGMSASNLTAGSGMKQFSGPLGHGRVQSVSPLAVTACGVYYSSVAGTFNVTSKYFISTYVHKTVAAATAQLRILNGTDDQILSSNTPSFVGWNRISSVKTWPNAATNAFDIWPIYASSNIGTGYAGGFCIIDLTAFDTAYGTSIATLPISVLEEIIDFKLLSDRFREYVRGAAPTDGTYTVGDAVWNYPPALNGYAGYVCTADGTPGTWSGFGVVSSGVTGTGNDVLSASPTLTGTLIAAAATLSGALTLNKSGQTASSALVLSAGDVSIAFNETSETADGKLWDLSSAGSVMRLRLVNDASTTAISVYEFARTARVLNSIKFGNTTDNNSFQILGTGAVTLDALAGTGSRMVQADANGLLSAPINSHRSFTTGITASTTQTQGQGPLTTDINIVSTVANANDTVTLPVAVAGMEIYIRNNGANTLKIYPASGDNINGTGVDASVTLATGTSVTYRTADTTNWYS